jgi:hypothetical protein
MMLTADQNRRLAEVFEEVAADRSVSPEYRARFAERAARFRALAKMAERQAKARRLN